MGGGIGGIGERHPRRLVTLAHEPLAVTPAQEVKVHPVASGLGVAREGALDYGQWRREARRGDLA